MTSGKSKADQLEHPGSVDLCFDNVTFPLARQKQVG